MQINEYQRLAAVTRNMELNKNDSLLNAAFGLIGESGEVIDLIKKHLCQGHEINKEKLKNELGDVSWYVALACTISKIDLQQVLSHNISSDLTKCICIKPYKKCEVGKTYYLERDWLNTYYDEKGSLVESISQDFNLDNHNHNDHFSDHSINIIEANDYSLLSSMIYDGKKKSNDKDNLIDYSFDMIDSSFEVSNIIRSYLIGDDTELDVFDLKEELGKVFMNISIISKIADLNLEDVLTCNIDKLKSRYPEGFSTLASVNREEYSK